MSNRFKNIESEIKDNKLLLTAEYDDSVLVVVELSKDRLVKMYPREFSLYKKVHLHNQAPEYIPTADGEASLAFWYDEFLTKRVAEELFGEARLDDIVVIESNN